MRRRQLIKGLGVGGALSMLPRGLYATERGEPMKILFMGGTGFIGPHMVRALVEQGHELTLFNRGRTRPELFDELELIKGDRFTEDLQQLADRRWDVVIDSAAYVPRAVDTLLDVLDLEHVQQYLFISTISVYLDFSRPGISESSATATMPDPSSEDVNQYYGALKVLCEQAAEKALPGKVTSIRCGLIVGPGDPTDRFTYWPERVFRGGEVLAPGQADGPIQTLDVRDLADWVAQCVQERVLGIYNAAGPAGAQTFGDVLELSRQALNPDARLVWVPHEFLLQQGLQQMQDLPFWVDSSGELKGVWQTDTSKAVAAGLRQRPLLETLRDTHAWFQTLPAERRETLRAGLSPQRESEVLSAWRNRHQ